MDFKGKVILITGASSGIGAETAVHFASLGASLSLTGRNADRLEDVAEKCKKVGNNEEPFTVIGDVSKDGDVENLLKETINHYGKLDVLVNNAGISKWTTLENLSLETYDKILNTNLRSAVYLTKLAAPYLIQSKGNVVNVSSVAGLRPYSLYMSYCISKSGLDQFTKCAALDLAPKQVRVNSVNPGFIMTDTAKIALSVDGKINDAAVDDIKRKQPFGRIAEPNEVTSVIAFLASDLASNVTGVLLPVDGGFSITSAM